ncbi:MAG: threonine synthase [candidate division KSB1 bacterium]|nr:threonine synthase [candidate division KSB1 bacterium]
MQCKSTRDQSPVVSFRKALFNGQAPDGGLYMPVMFPRFDAGDLRDFASLDYRDLVFRVLTPWLKDELQAQELQQIIEKAYSFAPNVEPLNDRTSILELFHGPTLSFKDFGAQFMAKSMGFFMQRENQELTILTATSGDTGSAVAHAYHNVKGIRIVLLYPSGQVSKLQEKQFTTLGDNIVALEVDGTFDDCQALVKTAFRDPDLNAKKSLSSANSINIGRLLPQSIYYFKGVLELYDAEHSDAIDVCVPSGNFGNLCAGLFAAQMGCPVNRFIAAVNANAVVPEYLKSGEYKPRASVRTLSNAMDVGNPSNWERIRYLFNGEVEQIASRIGSTSVNDASTLQTMQQIYADYGYIADPHTSVALEALQRSRSSGLSGIADRAIVLSTAHPGKFRQTVSRALEFEPQLPPALERCLNMDKKAQPLDNRFDAFKDFLWTL